MRLKRMSAQRLFFMEVSTFAESCELRLLFSSLFLSVLWVSSISSSSGEIEALVESDSRRGHSFPSVSPRSLLASSCTEQASSLKKRAISCFCWSRCCSCPSKSRENSVRKYLMVMVLLRPRQSGSKAKRMLERLRQSASSIICSSRRPSRSSLTVATHFSSLKGAYSQQSCTSLGPSRLFSRLTSESWRAARRKCTICRIVSRSSSQLNRRLFLTIARVSSRSTEPSSPHGYPPSISTMNSFGITIILQPHSPPVRLTRRPRFALPPQIVSFLMIIPQKIKALPQFQAEYL